MTALSHTMQEALTQFRASGNFGDVRKTTIAGLERRGMIQTTPEGYALTDTGKGIVKESQTEPRPNRLGFRWNMPQFMPTFDIGQADYAFWDKARRGRAQGLELGGLFIKPLSSKIASWTLGQIPKIRTENDLAQEKLSDWVGEYHSKLIEAYEEACSLGDCYLLINADLTVTILPPQVVMPILAQYDYSQIIGYRVTEVHQNPYNFSRMTIVNDYTATERVRTVTVDVPVTESGVYRVQSNAIRTDKFKNLIGKIPIIHISNDAGSDERYGHPVAEGLLHAMYRYDEVLQYAISGNKRQGRPTPVIEEMGDIEQIEQFWQKFGREETYTDADGKEQKQPVLDFDADQMLTLGGGAKFKWASPNSFTTDTQNLLELIFYLILQHSEIPEFVWGNAIASSKASAESQMPPFVRFIEKKQGEVTRWLNQVLDVALSLIRIYETSIPQGEKASIAWMPLTNADGALTVQAVQFAFERGLVDKATALRLLPLDIENPADVIAKAKAEQAEADEEYDRRQEAMLTGQRRNQDLDDENNPDGGEEMQDDQ